MTTTTAATNLPPGEKPTLPLTVSEYAAYHRVGKTTVKKWVKQNRIKAERRGGAGVRGAVVLIWQLERPDRAAPGTLTPEQRAAWNKGRRGKKKKEATAS